MAQQSDRLAFGLFELDPKAGELWRGSHKVRLAGQPITVLIALLARPGDVITREELRRQIWGANTTVDFERALAGTINKIREALGDSADNPRFIQTLPKRGYRFIAPVTSVESAPDKLRPERAMQQMVPISATDGDESTTAVPTTALQPESAWNLPHPPLKAQGLGQSIPAGTLRAEPVAARRFGIRFNLWVYPCLAAAFFIAGAALARVLLPTPKTAPLRVEQLTHYVPISLGPPNPESFLTMAMDGDRVLTSVIADGLPRLSAIDLDTGEVRNIAVPDEIASNSLTDISKDGSRLLLRSQQSRESEQPLWVIPTAGGSGRRVPGVLAHDAAWMPDGASILYANGNELAVIGPNEDSSKPFAKLPGRAFWLRWSPDGKLLRFTLFDPVTHATALWEMQSGSHTASPIALAGLERSPSCCGVWLPDGASYVFQAGDNLWEIKGAGRGAKPVQLTNGPLRSLSPVAARSGNRIFFLGLEAPSGLQQLDPNQREFRPAPAFLAEANRIDFSKDGKWVAWTDIHEKLWRARSDGSDKIRLTSDALQVFLAHWSPDGQRLAVMAKKPGGVWQIYVVDAGGGKAEALLEEARNAADPGWSVDGGSLVFGREPELMGKENGTHTLQIINLSTRRLEQIPNSEGLFSPRWSPDGRWIAALTLDQKSIMLFDVARKSWQRLSSTSASDPVWSMDSKALYVHAFLADRDPVMRIEVPSGATKTVADLGNFHDVEPANYFFGGITPGGGPLVQPRVGTGNLYSLELTTTP